MSKEGSMNSKIKMVVGLLAGPLLSSCMCMNRHPAVAHNKAIGPEHARAMLAAPPTEVVVEQDLKPIFFNFDSNELTSPNREILRVNAELAASYPEKNLRLEGNCDERGTTEYNVALGQRRAQAAFDYLQNLGLATSRMTTVSYGEENPFDSGHNEEAWAKNRRVVSNLED